MIRSMDLQGEACPNDGNPECFDDDPESFLSYVTSQPEIEIDPKVKAFLACRSQYAMPERGGKTKIDKNKHNEAVTK